MFKFIPLYLLLASTAFAASNNTYIQGPTLIESLSTTATAAGTTTLTVASNTNQDFSGSTTQNLVFPAATTLKVGQRYNVWNRSTGVVTVKDGSAATLLSLQGNSYASFVLVSNSTTAGTWSNTSRVLVCSDLPALTGDVTSSACATTLGAGVVTNANVNASAAIADTKLATISTASKVSNSATTATSANTASAIVARDGSGNFSAGTITGNLTGNASGTAATFTGALTGDVTSSAMATTIAANAVTNAKAAQMAAHTHKGNNTGSTANAIDLTQAQLTAEINTFTTSLSGAVPSSGGGTTNYLRADGTFAQPPGSSSGKITGELFMFAGTACPSGAIEADGTSELRTGGTGCGGGSCAALFTAISTAWGTADGTHFNIPDMRGRVPRGYAHTSANDPDRASRTACKTGGTTGDNVGSCQADATKKNGLALTDPGHSHTDLVSSGSGINGPYGGGVAAGNSGTSTTGITLGGGDNETRMINAAVLYCVQY